MDTDGKTTAGDFICTADIYEMKNAILRLQQELPWYVGQNTDAINLLENRTTILESRIIVLEETSEQETWFEVDCTPYNSTPWKCN